MKISTTTSYAKATYLYVFIPEKGFTASQYADKMPASVTKAIKTVTDAKEFEGKIGQIVPVVNIEPKMALVGIGEGTDQDVKKAAAKVMKKANKHKHEEIDFVLPQNASFDHAIVGAELGNYIFKIGDRKDLSKVKKTTLITKDKKTKKDWSTPEVLGHSVNYVRDLVNTPPDRVRTTTLAKEAREIAKIGGASMKVKVLGEKEAKKLGMGALLAVGQGAKDEVQLIVLEYKAGGRKEPLQAYVGKGIVFDSGGYNLKPSNHIEDMKMDMAGAATVLGLFHWLAHVKPKKNVVGVIAAAENMISANSYRPGDIITAMNGKTIEIANTDAEGRLVLADALHYTVTNLKPKSIVDLATLTGAVIHALGHEITGVMGNNKELIGNIQKASEKVGEMVWELPITDTFREGTKNDISDLKNLNRKLGAGSSLGGAFLENFVGDTPWAHLDIAGTAFETAEHAFGPRGATGAMLQTLVELVEQ